jgi:hypothetical protein
MLFTHLLYHSQWSELENYKICVVSQKYRLLTNGSIGHSGKHSGKESANPSADGKQVSAAEEISKNLLIKM